MASCSLEVYIAIAKMGGMTWLANRPAPTKWCRRNRPRPASVRARTRAIVVLVTGTRDKNFTRASIKRRMEQVEASIDRYLSALATADRHDSEIAEQKSERLKDKLASLRAQMQAFKALE